jgi:hypothetical protein
LAGVRAEEFIMGYVKRLLTLFVLSLYVAMFVRAWDTDDAVQPARPPASVVGPAHLTPGSAQPAHLRGA